MKLKSYIKLSGAVLVTLLLMFLIYSGTGKKAHQKKIQPKRKETEVYVDIIKEKKKTPEVSKITPEETNNETKQVNETVIKEEDINGELPPLSANYRKYVGFKKYSQEMTRIGCRFFVVGNGIKNLYEIDFNDKVLNKINIKVLKIGDYSSRSRIITDEPALNKYIDSAKKKYNIENPEVIMLVPKTLERTILKELLKYNLPIEKTSSLKGYYKQVPSGMILIINEAVIEGRIQYIDIEINI